MAAPIKAVLQNLTTFIFHKIVIKFASKCTVHQDLASQVYSISTLRFPLRVRISSRKHAYIVLTPLKPHFYTVKLGSTGVYINFLISAQNIDCGYWLEPPHRGGSNQYQQSMF